jgi:hypothetical protein
MVSASFISVETRGSQIFLRTFCLTQVGVNHREDPSRPYSFYDLTKDADSLMVGSEYSKAACFSQVKQWKRKDDVHI